MKNVRSLWPAATLGLFLSFGIALSAQQTPSAPPSAQPPNAQAQQPTSPGQTQPPAATAPAPPAAPDATQTGPVQNFSGTVVKSGDKYVLQDEASGKTYDVDHQDEVQKFEGKRVRVKGTVDPNGNLIHLQ
jgi:Protein of unknown function (DUF5818)